MIDRSVYGFNGNIWFEGVPDSDVGTFVEYPFTIGVKYDYLNGHDGPAGKQIILDTNATVTVQGVTYNNVVIVEDLYHEYVELDTNLYIGYQRTYIARGHGIIKTENGIQGEAPNWTKELAQKIPLEAR